MGNCCGNSSMDPIDQTVSKDLDDAKGRDRQIKKLLLLGAGSSGKTTFFKQLKRIHGDGFTPKDRKDFQAQIENQIIEQMQKLISRSRELIQENSEYKHLQLQTTEAKDSAVFIESLRRDIEINDEVAYHIETLWKDTGIKNTFAMRAKLAVPDSCDYFFNNVKKIAAVDYVPSDEDILLVRKRTTGIIEEFFTIKGTRFHIFDVGGQRNERKKWIHCFENVTSVVFVVSLSCYDEALLEDEDVNVMHETLELFNEICNSPWFTQTHIILFLNKRDLLEIKIKEVPLTVCFPSYNGQNTFNDALTYITTMFQSKNQNTEEKLIYVHVTCATDRQNVERVFNDVQHMIVTTSLQRGGLM